MTIAYITPDSSVIKTTGHGATMTWGDTLSVLQGAYVGTTDAAGYGVHLSGSSTARSTVNVMGTIAANYGGIYLRDLVDGLADIMVSSTGIISTQRYAIEAVATSALQALTIRNDGTVSASAGPAIYAANTNFTLVNTGLIAGLHDGDAVHVSGLGTWVDIVNSGTLVGGIYAACAAGGLIEVENSGLIEGNLRMDDASSGSLWLRNSGRISGFVQMLGEAGHDVTAELQGGSIAGSVNLASGGILTVDLSGAHIGGSLSIAGDYDYGTVRFDNAWIEQNLYIRGAAAKADLTGIHVANGVYISDPATVEFHAGQIGALSASVGDDLLDLTGGRVMGMITPGAGNDTLVTGDFAERVSNGPGDDDYALGGGNDTLFIGVFGQFDGNDTVEAGAGIDTLNLSHVADGYAPGDGALWVSLEEGLLRAGLANTADLFGKDVVTGFENVIGGAFDDGITGSGAANRLTGGLGEDTLYGLGGTDTLAGGEGADRLAGGGGRDLMRGGAGADVFVFTSAADSGLTRALRDQITDFVAGEDRISLAAIDANTGVAGKQAFTFAGQTGTSGAGTVRFIHDHGDTVIQLNLDADTATESTILLHGLVALTAADFALG